MDHFLTSVLQLVIVLDILGVIAYFVLGSLRSRSRKPQAAPAPIPHSPSLWDRLRWRPALSESPEALAPALDNLKRVLYSYQQGLI